MTHDPAECAEVLIDLRARAVERRLTYRIPETLRGDVRVGSRVAVPLGPRTVHGFVIALAPCGSADERPLRDVQAVTGPQPVFSPRMLRLAAWIAEHTVSTLLEAVHCLAPPEILRRRTATARQRVIASLGGGTPAGRTGPRQTRILAVLRARGEAPVEDLVREGGRPAFQRLVAQGAVLLKERPPAVPARESATGATPLPLGGGTRPAAPMLLWGEDAARRGWILARGQDAVARGGQALIIVPEITLVPLLAEPLGRHLGQAVTVLHSGMAPRERRAAWERCVAQDVRIVVGTRSALFAPLDRVRLIVVDDEHDPVHQADAAPRYHARDVALRRGALEGANVVLGSLTPSVETYAEAACGRMECVRLPASGPPICVTIADMRAAPSRGPP